MLPEQQHFIILPSVQSTTELGGFTHRAITGPYSQAQTEAILAVRTERGDAVIDFPFTGDPEVAEKTADATWPCLAFGCAS